MKLTMCNYHAEEDYWRIRNFLREVFLFNDRLEHSWHVARLDYWRWHFIRTCHVCESVEKGTILWETTDGKITAVLTDFGNGEIRLHVHPHFRSTELENEMLAYAEDQFSDESGDGGRILYLPIFSDDLQRQGVARQRCFAKREGWGHHYRRDLDIVAAASDGSIAAFCTIFYDDYTRSAVCVLVGTAVEHWKRGLGKAAIFEGMRRLKHLGCTRVFATAYDPPADALYRFILQDMKITNTWIKEWTK